MVRLKLLGWVLSLALLAAAYPVLADDVAAEPLPQATEAVDGGAEAVTGSVAGRVTNGTAGAALAAPLTVTLHIVDAHFGEETMETTTDAQGVFRFDDVPLRDDRDYAVTTVYNEAMFVSDIAPGVPSAGELTLPLTIYEGGAQPADVRIDNVTSQVGVADDGRLQVVQIVRFSNVSDRVYLNPDTGTPTSVSLRLPADAQFESFMGGEYVQAEDSAQVFDTRPVVPGEAHVMHLVFSLPYTGSLNLEQVFDYPVEGPFEVLLAAPGLSVGGDGMAAAGPRNTNSGVLMSFVKDVSQPAGQPVTYQVSGQPAAAPESAAPAPAAVLNPLALVLIFAGVGAIGLAVVLFMRERLAPASGEKLANALMKQIAELDMEHRDGRIDEATYERQRSVLKTRLTSVMKTR